MIGTIANAGAIVAGGLLGVVIHSRLSQKMIDIVFQGLGLVTFVLGVSLALKSESIILIVISVVVGSIIGEWLDMDKYMNKLSVLLQQRSKRGGTKETEAGAEVEAKSEVLVKSGFSEGFITASMLFCVGSMAILGSFQDGMGESPDILYAKSVMDGISSIALASSFGIGVIFSSVPLMIYQGGLTLFAAFIMRFMSDEMMADLTATGGVLLIGLAISILKIKTIRVINMLPALVIIVILSYFFS